MGLFSSFRKNKQESAAPQGQFLSRSAGDSSAARGRTTNSRKTAKNGKPESTDPLLPEKKRARRRLIGALALVLAMVIVLPMILDSEPKPLADDIAIQIPSKDAGKEPAKTAKAEGSQPKEEFIDPATLAQDKPATTSPSTPAPAAIAVPVPAQNAANAALNAPAPAPAPAPAKQAEVPVVEKPVAQAKTEAPAKETVKPVAKPEQKDSKVASQAGKTSEAKAEPKKEATKSKSVEKSDNSDDADRALAILEGKSIATEKKPAPSAANGKFVIQVAALATQEKIDELRNKLSNAGIKSFTQKVATQSGDRTRIRVGPFSSRDEADKVRAKINKLGLNATIVPA